MRPRFWLVCIWELKCFCGLAVQFWEITDTEVKYAAMMSRLTFLNKDGADCHGRKIIYALAFASVIGSVNL